VDVTLPLLSADVPDGAAALAAALAIGAAFGWALERAGLGSARKLAAQFYLTDLTVFRVMFSAIVTAMLGVFWLSRLGLLDVTRVYVPATYLAPQAVGGLVFGAGMVMGGLCPGTSCVAAATGRRDGLAVIAGMLIGVLLFDEAFPLVRGFYESTPRGTFTLPELLHLPYGVLVFAIVALALGGFAMADGVERHFRRRGAEVEP
jgi:uncharacterized membrane protein YedE/YeeE